MISVYALCGPVPARHRARSVLAASLAASFANPYLWRLHAHILRYLAPGSWQFEHINEFFSPGFHAPPARYFELMLACGMAAAVWHLARRRPHYAVLLAGAGHMALMSARHIPIFLIVGAPPVALALEEWLAAAARADLPRLARRLLEGFMRLAADTCAIERVSRIPAVGLLASAVVAAAVSSPSASGKLRAEFDPSAFPVRATETLGGAPGRIYTSDQWGDYLIYRLYPDIRVFVDGRSDFYGDDLEQSSLNVWNVRHDWQRTLDRYQVDTVLLPVDAPLAGALKESARWRVAYDDGSAIVFRASAGETQRVSGRNLAASYEPESPQSP
jgi:hypothetical protein